MNEISGRKFATIAVVLTFCLINIGALVLTIMKLMNVTTYLAATGTLGTITLYIVKAYFDDKDRHLEAKGPNGIK